MNNDISAELKFTSAKKCMPVKSSHVKSEASIHANSSDDFKSSMDFLGNLGCAKVNMEKNDIDKNVAKTVADYIANPDYAEMHTEFCDALVNKGYSLEDAINYTDKVFSALRDETIYE